MLSHVVPYSIVIPKSTCDVFTSFAGNAHVVQIVGLICCGCLTSNWGGYRRKFGCAVVSRVTVREQNQRSSTVLEVEGIVPLSYYSRGELLSSGILQDDLE
jgi:hypothetical protein